MLGAEGGAHVHFWWTQLVSQRRKNELFGSKVSFGRFNGRRMGWQLIIEYPLWQAHYAVFSKLSATAVSYYYSSFTEKKTEAQEVIVAYQARANCWWSNSPWTRIKIVWLQGLSFFHHSIVSLLHSHPTGPCQNQFTPGQVLGRSTKVSECAHNKLFPNYQVLKAVTGDKQSHFCHLSPSYYGL